MGGDHHGSVGFAAEEIDQGLQQVTVVLLQVELDDPCGRRVIPCDREGIASEDPLGKPPPAVRASGDERASAGDDVDLDDVGTVFKGCAGGSGVVAGVVGDPEDVPPADPAGENTARENCSGGAEPVYPHPRPRQQSADDDGSGYRRHRDKPAAAHDCSVGRRQLPQVPPILERCGCSGPLR